MAVILNPSPESGVAARILAVAMSILAEVGEAGLRIDEVMSRASVQAPVIYRHFGSREGLVQSAHLARFIDSMRIESGRFLADTLAATDAATFRMAVDAMVDALLCPENIAAGAVKLEVLAMSTNRPEVIDAVQVMQRANYAQPLEALELAQRRGWVRGDIDVRTFLVWAIASTFGLAAVTSFRKEPGVAENWAVNHRHAIRAVLFGSDC